MNNFDKKLIQDILDRSSVPEVVCELLDSSGEEYVLDSMIGWLTRKYVNEEDGYESILKTRYEALQLVLNEWYKTNERIMDNIEEYDDES